MNNNVLNILIIYKLYIIFFLIYICTFTYMNIHLQSLLEKLYKFCSSMVSCGNQFQSLITFYDWGKNMSLLLSLNFSLFNFLKGILVPTFLYDRSLFFILLPSSVLLFFFKRQTIPNLSVLLQLQVSPCL